ncbi:MAG: tRNA (adenosine(37)-N6)-threonylcarbamoyltransferase complex transferase subunit TsaD [Planctomycetes bacterium]|nr:tRNA (adenosine(37)-N6)-threonylcarbamoyltransferase complex transferase subunit TsaD [Planctomycetota bacterium]
MRRGRTGPGLILGIESSCDETAASVVRDGHEILSSIVTSQVDRHRVFGGVVPEIACRLHTEAILGVIDAALADAGVRREDLDAVAVTHTPGLVGALLVGLSAAKTLSYLLDIPLIGVDHIQAHLYAATMAERGAPPYPAVGLVVSGGHTAVYDCRGPGRMTRLGKTIDDAAGEAFDKTAAILGLEYPGGPSIEKAARSGRADAIRFPRSDLGPGSLDFSFSGVKTAVLYHCKGRNAGRSAPLKEGICIQDVAASFQEAVVEVLVDRTLAAAERLRANHILLGGGVACNTRLRERLRLGADLAGRVLHLAPPSLCTDNAAMVAGLGYHRLKAGRVSSLRLDAVPTP